MKYKNYLLIFLAVIGLSIVIPKTASAFWWFGQKKTTVATKTTTVSETVLSEQDKINLAAKYKIWCDAFESKNIEAAILNQNNFSFTVPEINYLLKDRSKKSKNPTLTGASVTTSNGNINVAATFHKIINGQFSFVAKVVSVNNKIRLKLSAVRLFGVPVPTSWLEGPVNNALDEYFAFLYKDSRYQGFAFTNNNGLFQLKLNFAK
jgi:hypothetical protein